MEDFILAERLAQRSADPKDKLAVIERSTYAQLKAGDRTTGSNADQDGLEARPTRGGRVPHRARGRRECEEDQGPQGLPGATAGYWLIPRACASCSSTAPTARSRTVRATPPQSTPNSSTPASRRIADLKREASLLEIERDREHEQEAPHADEHGGRGPASCCKCKLEEDGGGGRDVEENCASVAEMRPTISRSSPPRSTSSEAEEAAGPEAREWRRRRPRRCR